jgi:uncharacterized protein (TIGR03083 family)
MSERARALAERFEQANRELIATVERLSDADWKTETPAEHWTVGVVAHHVAGSHKDIAGLVEMVASGKPVPPLNMDTFDQANAAHAREHANCTKAETLALLRQNGARAAETVRALGDEQLDRVGGSMGMSAAQIIERVLIGHIHEHHGSIKSALQQGR